MVEHVNTTGALKTTSVKLRWIAAVLAITAAPMGALAIDGPDPATWIPGTDIVETVGSLTNVRRQPGPYYARDVFKTFVPAVAGKDLQLIVTGPGGEKVDYFDERRSNGLYAVFGSVDAGTITLKYQWSLAGAGIWIDAGTTTLTVAARRTLIYDTGVPINVWYTVYDSSPSPGSNLAGKLDTDFPVITGQGFTSITYVNNTSGKLGTIFSKLNQHGLKVQISMPPGAGGVRDLIATNRYMAAHNNVPILLSLENALIAAGLNTDVGGGVLMKNHPQLWAYYVYDEPYDGLQNPLELALMMTKSIDPNHSGIFAIGGYVGASWGPTIAGKTMFSDFMLAESYPFIQTPLTPTSDFTEVHGNPSGGWPSVPAYLSDLRSYDSRRYVENIAQAFWSNPGGVKRPPSPKELRALTLIGAARGVRPFTYFTLRTFTGVNAMLNGSNGPTNGLWAEAGLINTKLASWMPIYKNLNVSSTGSKPITYEVNGAVAGNFVHKITGDRYLIVVNTNTVSTKTVTVNDVINNTGGTATTAKDVVSGMNYNLSGGVLNISLAAGDGALLAVDAVGGTPLIPPARLRLIRPAPTGLRSGHGQGKKY